MSCPDLAPFAGLPCRRRGGCRARQRPPCVKGAVCPSGRLGDCLFPLRWAVNTIPPSRLRRATSLYAREAKPLRFASLSTSPFRGGLTGAPKAPIPPCHSEERSDEESREQNAKRNHTGSFTLFRMTAIFMDHSSSGAKIVLIFNISVKGPGSPRRRSSRHGRTFSRREENTRRRGSRKTARRPASWTVSAGA